MGIEEKLEDNLESENTELVPGKLEVKPGKSKLRIGIKYGCLGLLVGSIVAYSQFKQEIAWWIQKNPNIVKYTPPLIDKVYGLLFERKDLLRISSTTAPVEYLLTAKADVINESVADEAYKQGFSNSDLRELREAGYIWGDLVPLVGSMGKHQPVPKDYAIDVINEIKERNIVDLRTTDLMGHLAHYGFACGKSPDEVADLFVKLLNEDLPERYIYDYIMGEIESKK